MATSSRGMCATRADGCELVLEWEMRIRPLAWGRGGGGTPVPKRGSNDRTPLKTPGGGAAVTQPKKENGQRDEGASKNHLLCRIQQKKKIDLKVCQI